MTDANLQEFVQQTAPEFDWCCIQQESSGRFPGITVCELELTSQVWRGGIKADINQSLWQHRLTLYLPDTGVQPAKPCLLMVQGGYRHQPELETSPTAGVDGARICADTKAPVALLRDIPNQPLITPDGVSRVEDDLVAWSWQQFLESPDNTPDNTPDYNSGVLLQWPMVKAVVRAMDAIEAFYDQPIPSFIVSGASKRGWVTWLAATCDNRISAIIPIVIDVLNVQACIKHHHKVYGGWAEAISDYAATDHDILADLETDNMKKLLQQVDPIHYLQQLSLPKLIINASCDEFFPPDSAQFYFHKLKGFSALRYLPNASHYLGRDSTVNMTEVITSCFAALISECPLPEITWQSNRQGTTLTVSRAPVSARVWYCNNPDKRDFRKPTLQQSDLAYQAIPLTPDSTLPRVYHYQPQVPVKGWEASFIEVQFDNAPFPNLVYTSGVNVLPEIP